MTPGTGIPGWLSDILPAWCKAHPEFTEAAFAAVKSLIMASGTILGTVFGTAVGSGFTDSPQNFIFFLVHGGGLWGAFVGFLVGSGWARMQAGNAGAKAKAAASQPSPPSPSP